MEREKIKGKAKASASWARLIHKIFEVDPLLYPNCGKEMKIIAFITNHQEVKKILSISEKKTKGLLPFLLSCAMSWKTPMTGETFRQMKLIFVMQNGAFKPQRSPCLKSSIFRPA